MDSLSNGEILEVRSRERTVEEDLPAWCRMVDHQFLGFEPGDNTTRYFIRKGSEQGEVEQDASKLLKGMNGVVRVQAGTDLSAKIHCVGVIIPLSLGSPQILVQRSMRQVLSTTCLVRLLLI